MNEKSCVFLLVLIYTVGRAEGLRAKQQFFRTRPQDSFVAEGGRAIISCVIGNLGGRVQWTKDGLTLGYNRELPGFKRYSVVGTDESGVFNLQILNSTLQDEAEYECQVGPNGTNKAIRESARLHVLLPPTKAEFVGYSSGSQLVVQENEDIELSCRVEDAKPKPDIIWYIGGVEITKGRREDVEEKGSTDRRITVLSTIRFRPTAVDNLKTIACEAQHPALTGGALTASLQIFVQYPPGHPVITGYTPGEPIKKGSRVSLSCKSEGGNPPATLTWYREGERIDSSYTDREDGSTNTYEFIAQAKDNNAVYTCSASNDLIKTPLQADINIQVLYGPEEVRIIGESEARAGDLLSFECVTSDSNPPVDVWWVVDGRAVQGNHTRTLASEGSGGWFTRTNITVRIGARDTAKNIQCHAVNQAVGETKVQTHTVGVLYPFEAPRIIGYDSKNSLTGGVEEKIRCTSQGGNPLATLQWFHRDTEIPSEYIPGDNHATAVLVLNPNITDNGAVYRCVASSRAVAKPVETTVRFAVKYAPSAVKIQILPDRLHQGTEATLECESGESNPPSTLVWIHNGVPLSGQLFTQQGSYGGKISKNVLKFKVKTEDNGSVFTCKAENEVGEAIDAVTMSIAYKPVFPVLSGPVEVKEGEELILNMTAHGNPQNMEYRWSSPTGELLSQESKDGVRVEGGVLNISRVLKEFAGTYKVSVNNSEGVANTSFKLDILYSPRITSLTEYVMVEEGDTAVFECLFHANPLTLDGIVWRREEGEGWKTLRRGEDTPTSSASWEEIGGNSINSRLVLRNVSEKDIGRFLCAVDNGVGEETVKETYLLVSSKPQMVVSKHLSKSAAGNRETCELRCRAEGAPNITFTWRRTKGELAAGNKYEVFNTRINPLVWESIFHVRDVNPADYGVYECIARNRNGVSKTQIVLQEPTVPDKPDQFRVLNVTGDSVILAWEPGFDGGREQIYRIQYHRRNPGSMYKQPSYYDVYPMNSTSVLISGLTSSSLYAFSIQSLNDLGESSYTKDIEAKTLSDTSQTSNQPLVDGLTDTTSQNIPVIITITVAVCGTLLLLLAVVLITCLVHKRKMKKSTASRSSSSNSTKSAAQDGLFNGSQGTSCYNDTMSEETMSSISEKSGSYIAPIDGRLSGLPYLMPSEGYRPHAASTYLTDQVGGIYSVDQGREIGFTSSNLPLNMAKTQFTEDTESQYADELRRQAYIQTLGDGYNISQIGSSISYPNSPIADYFPSDLMESDLQEIDRLRLDHQSLHPINNFPTGSVTLGRNSGRFGSRKSSFTPVKPSSGGGRGGPLSTPPACSTPQNHFPILSGLNSPNRNLPEFSTFGTYGVQGGHLPQLREEIHEPNGHLV